MASRTVLAMELRYDEDFVEAAAFLCTSGLRKGVSSLQIFRFHRERERLYAILEPEERNTAFFRLHLEWFREWGLEEVLTGLVKEFRWLFGKARCTRSAQDEGEKRRRCGTLRQRGSSTKRHHCSFPGCL